MVSREPPLAGCTQTKTALIADEPAGKANVYVPAGDAASLSASTLTRTSAAGFPVGALAPIKLVKPELVIASRADEAFMNAIR